MAVNDHGLETIRKAGEEVTPGDKSDHYIKVNAGSLLGGIKFDTITVTYPTSTTEVFAYKTGGTGGTTVATITLTYATDCKEDLVSAVRT